ncbi:MAG TPA: N-acetylmuramic acid 6-phosphate etherase [Ktedonobacterales bacterium]|nr:N-acetylmuramic acid 6-phosphate etherase [Ktedonobacterales bacterium]
MPIEPDSAELSPPTFAALATEQANPATAAVDRMSALEIVQLMNAEDATVALAVREVLPAVAAAIDGIADRLRSGGRLIYVGAGTSGRLGALDAIECPPTFNVSPAMVVGQIAGGAFALSAASEEAEDDAEAGREDLTRLDVSAHDAVVGISASGRTPYVLGALARAQEGGAFTAGVVCNAGTLIDRVVDVLIAPLVGPEVIAGSTRLKAGTAQKMVLNMLSTGVMIRLGKTYGNLMVDVRATNAKLRARALDIVRRASGVSAEEAAALLGEADGEAKTAILIARAQLAPQQARDVLGAHQGELRAALDALGY